MAGKKPSHRRAIIKSLLIELIQHERLQTTKAKTAILKSEFDKLVNVAKKGTPASIRDVESVLQYQPAVEKLTSVLVPRLQDQNSGYTVSANTLPRKGDNAPQVVVMIKGAQIREKRSKIEKALAKQEKQKPVGIAEKVKGVVAKQQKLRETKKKDSTVSVRRNSK